MSDRKGQQSKTERETSWELEDDIRQLYLEAYSTRRKARDIKPVKLGAKENKSLLKDIYHTTTFTQQLTSEIKLALWEMMKNIKTSPEHNTQNTL